MDGACGQARHNSEDDDWRVPKHIELAIRMLHAPMRLELLVRIGVMREASVQALTSALDISITCVSNHLKVLRENGLVQRRRDASWLLYSLTPRVRLAQDAMAGCTLALSWADGSAVSLRLPGALPGASAKSHTNRTQPGRSA